MKRSISLKLQKTYKTITRVPSITITPVPLRVLHAASDCLFNFSIEKYNRKLDALIDNISNFVRGTKIFIKEILIARKNRRSIRLFSKELKATIDSFRDYQKTIQSMLEDITKKTSRYSIANVVVKSFKKGLMLLVLLLIVACARQLSIPTAFHSNVTYMIPADVFDRVLFTNISTILAPNRTTEVTKSDASTRSSVIDYYTYPLNEMTNPNATQVVQTTRCNASSACTDIIDSIASLKILLFSISLLWGVVFLVGLKCMHVTDSF